MLKCTKCYKAIRMKKYKILHIYKCYKLQNETKQSILQSNQY